MEYEAVDDGVMAKIVVPEGTNDVPVNQLIAVMAQEGEDPKAAAAAAGTGVPAPKAPTAPAPLPPHPSPRKPRRHRLKRRRPHRLRRRRRRVRGLGPTVTARTAPSLRRWRGAWPKKPASRSAASPAPARMAASSPATLPRPRKARACAHRGRGGGCRSRDRAVDVGPADPRALRRRQLRAYSARRHAPHHRAAAHRLGADHSAFLSHRRLRHRQALAAREEINAAAPKDKDGKPAYKLSVNDFVIKALALALQRVPDANVSWTEAGMLKHKHSDVGVAVACRTGLITPIIRNAETKSLSAISNEMKDLALRARARKNSSRRNIRAAGRRCRTSACTASRISPR
jgi:pyruvate dehydrogenase E2 component (dihydrolipoamide acetyltransferase)